MENPTHFQGLSPEEVVKSREQHGSNVLTPPEKTSIWEQLLEKFKDPIIRILLVALALSFLVACYQFFSGAESGHVFLEPVGILVAILLATGVGFYFELKANKKFDILNQVNDDVMVKVIRGGRVTEVSRKDIVVGDYVILEAGNEVPADGYLKDAMSMQVNESTLTGEPIVNKTIDPERFDKDATYPSNKVLRGTTVMEGHGIMEVNTVGDQTEYGKVYTGSQIENNVETPLNMQLEKLANTSVVSKKVGWEGNFNDMALKTVIRRLLSKYGYLSIEMQGAMAADDDTMNNRDMVLDDANAQVINIDTTFEPVNPAPAQSPAPAPAASEEPADGPGY